MEPAATSAALLDFTRTCRICMVHSSATERMQPVFASADYDDDDGGAGGSKRKSPTDSKRTGLAAMLGTFTDTEVNQIMCSTAAAALPL